MALGCEESDTGEFILMKEIIAQYTGKGFSCQSDDDMEIASNSFMVNQLVRLKVYNIGAKKARSLPANNLLHACFALLAENSDDPKLDTIDKVKFACKVALDYRYLDRVGYRPDGMVVFEYRSFGFKDLEHMESVNLFNRSYDWMAGIMGITVEELIAEAKSRMQTYR
jgi:hypothetical protein